MFNYDYAHRLLGLLHTLHTHKTMKIFKSLWEKKIVK